MSFSFEFTAKSVDDAERILAKEHAPDCVKTFIAQALKGIGDNAVYVKAVGHLYNRDYDASNAVLEVRKVMFRTPPAPENTPP